MTRQLMLKQYRVVIGIVVLLLTLSCDKLDDDRIPPAPVRISFTTVGDWNTFGIGGALDSRIFIKENLEPAGYHYTALSATGFGGVIIVGDVNGTSAAYDLACPVERKRDVRIFVNKKEMVGECPECHSTYDIFSLGGYPLTGVAADKGYGLRRYNVGPGRSEYMIVTN